MSVIRWHKLALCFGLQYLLIAGIDVSYRQVRPTKKLSLLVDQKDGEIDLAIKVKLTEDFENGRMANHTQMLLQALTGKNESQTGSWLKRMVSLQQRIQMQYVSDYSLYPQVVNMRQIVRAVLSGLPVDEAPMYNPSIKPIVIPKYVCHEELTKWPDLVVVVHTCATCVAARMHARNTFMKHDLWLEFSVDFVFVTLVSNNSQSGMNASKNNEELDFDLIKEADTYGDLLIGGPEASDWIETRTHILAMRWLTIYCAEQVPLFLFLNSSFSINPRNLIAFVRSIPRDLQKIMNVGLPPKSLKVPRNNELNAVTKDEIPWNKYPEYCETGAFFVGSELLEQASIAMTYTKPFKHASIYLGFIWAKLSYPVLKLPYIIHENGGNTTMSSLAVVIAEELDRVMDWNSGFLY